MIDFTNLTEEQHEFFNSLWENHQKQDEQTDESTKSFNAYIEQRRKQEDDQAKAAEVLKTKFV